MKSFFVKLKKNLINLKLSSYFFIGILNTIFAYFCSIYVFINLIKFIPDYVTFILSSIVNIIFSYSTMSLFVFKNKKYLEFNNFFKYVSSSFLNILFGVVLSTILIRIGFDIFITQAVTISIAIVIQLLINLILLTK